MNMFQSFFDVGLLALSMCLKVQTVVFVQHPDLAQYFDDTSATNPHYISGFIHLSKNEKTLICEKVLRATVYQSVPENRNLLPPSSPNMNDLFGHIKNLYNHDLLKAIQIIDVKLQVPTRILILPALPCILENDFAWFVTPGFYRNEYFALGKTDVNDNFFIHGIIEQKSEIDDVSYDRLLLEVHFLENFKSAAHKPNKRNFCHLQDHERFRLCSSAHLAWHKSVRIQTFKENFAHEKIGQCVENAVLSFRNISRDNVNGGELIAVDLIACAINAPWQEPQFYLAADQVLLDNAYLLQKDQIDSQEPTYHLIRHLRKMPPLKRESEIIPTLRRI